MENMYDTSISMEQKHAAEHRACRIMDQAQTLRKQKRGASRCMEQV
jgi:hypothetical protein